jgi:hypothetical protein
MGAAPGPNLSGNARFEFLTRSNPAAFGGRLAEIRQIRNDRDDIWEFAFFGATP